MEISLVYPEKVLILRGMQSEQNKDYTSICGTGFHAVTDGGECNGCSQ